jgi:hypothetical protein
MTPLQLERLELLANSLTLGIRQSDRQLGACILYLMSLHASGYDLANITERLAITAHKVTHPLMAECHQ